MAFAYLGQTNASSRSGTVVTLTRTFSANSGVFLYSLWNDAGPVVNPTSITDQASNTISFVRVAQLQISSGNYNSFGLFWIPNVGVGVTALTITLNVAPSSYANYACAEFSGLSSSITVTSGNTLSQSATAANGTNTVIAPLTATLAGSGAILFSVSTDETQTYAPASGTGMTNVSTTWASGAGTAQYSRITASGAVNALWSNGSTSGNTFGSLAVIIDEGSTGTATVSGVGTLRGAVGANATIAGAATIAGKESPSGAVLGQATLSAATVFSGQIYGYGTLNPTPLPNSAINGAGVLAGFSAFEAAILGFSGLVGSVSVNAAIEGQATLFADGYSFFGFEQAPPLRTVSPGIDARLPRVVKCLLGVPVTPRLIASKTPSENVLITFDFSAVVPTEVLIEAATIGAGIFSGVDIADTLTPSVPAINSSGTMVSAMVAGGISGCVYTIECLALLDDGQQLALLAKIPVQGFINEVSPIPPSTQTFIATETGALWVTESGIYITTD